MKIVDVEAFVLSHDLDAPFGFSQWWYRTRQACLVRVRTDAGIDGWGECYGPAGVTSCVVTGFLRPLVVGEDPFDSDVLWERMYNRSRDYGQKGVMVAGISGVDIALWDVKGKALGMPVYRLLGGGFRTRVQTYATGMYFAETENLPKHLAQEARSYADQGFRAMKMKVGLGVEADADNVRAVREAIGPGIQLMVDANHAFDAATAIRLGRRIEDLDIYWFEEPVTPEDLAGYVEVKAALNMAVAGGEAEFTRFGFRELISRRAVDIAQPDTCSAGGISEVKRISALASAYGVELLPHVWGSAVGVAAGLHLVASLPDTPPALHPTPKLIEYDRTENPFREQLLKEPLRWEDGFLAVPEGPGLGIEVDGAVLDRYRV